MGPRWFVARGECLGRRSRLTPPGAIAAIVAGATKHQDPEDGQADPDQVSPGSTSMRRPTLVDPSPKTSRLHATVQDQQDHLQRDVGGKRAIPDSIGDTSEVRRASRSGSSLGRHRAVSRTPEADRRHAPHPPRRIPRALGLPRRWSVEAIWANPCELWPCRHYWGAGESPRRPVIISQVSWSLRSAAPVDARCILESDRVSKFRLSDDRESR